MPPMTDNGRQAADSFSLVADVLHAHGYLNSQLH